MNPRYVVVLRSMPNDRFTVEDTQATPCEPKWVSIHPIAAYFSVEAARRSAEEWCALLNKREADYLRRMGGAS